MKLILECVIVIFITVVSFNVLQAQISTEEKPISFNYDTEMFRTNAEFSKMMPLIDIEKLILEDEEEIANGRPARFGYSHEVDFNLENSGQGFDLSDGGKLGKLVIYCPNALSINLLYDKFGLPDGAKFFIYSADKRHSIGAFTSTNNKGNKENIRGFATELVYGDKIVLEYYLPKGVTETGVISINNVIHGYRHVTMFNSFDNEKQKKGDSFQGFGDSPDCFVNVNCSPEGDNWRKEKNAVAMIVAGNYYYTGSLMNNTKNDYTPLLLTTTDAVHNPHDSKGNYVLDYTIFYGNYEAPACDAPVNAPSSKTTSGAVVISNDVVGTNNLYFTGFLRCYV